MKHASVPGVPCEPVIFLVSQSAEEKSLEVLTCA